MGIGNKQQDGCPRHYFWRYIHAWCFATESKPSHQYTNYQEYVYLIICVISQIHTELMYNVVTSSHSTTQGYYGLWVWSCVSDSVKTAFAKIGQYNCIPAIGADPHKTWRLPTDRGNQRGYIWSKVTDARTFLFTFEAPEAIGDFGITEWASKLLEALKGCEDIAGRPIHFAAHR